MMCHIVGMPSINMRQLRETRRLKAWLRVGTTVELRDRDKVIARIVPEKPEHKPAKWPDFEARAKEMFGDRIFQNIILEDRGRY
jgi:antitoxin (DNA-binding transcriptional repressor) of toxin-antitoxin stability system